MKTVDDILNKKPLTQSQVMRRVIWRWWDYEKRHGLTMLGEEEFYQEKMSDLIRDIKQKFPDERYENLAPN